MKKMARLFVCNDCKKIPQVHELCKGDPVELSGFLLYCAKCKIEKIDDIPEAKTLAMQIKRANGDWLKLNKAWNS